MSHNKDEIKVPSADDLKKLRNTDLPEKTLWINGLLEKMNKLPESLNQLDLSDRRYMLHNLLQWNKFIYEMQKIHQTVDFIPKWSDGKMRRLKYLAQESLFPKLDDGTRPILVGPAEATALMNFKEKLSHELKPKVRTVLANAENYKETANQTLENLEAVKLTGYPDRYEMSAKEASDHYRDKNGKGPCADAYIANEEKNIFAVLDGQGHKMDGKRASGTAKNHIERNLDKFKDDMSIKEVKETMKEILKGANDEILGWDQGTEISTTTISMVKFMPKDGTAVIGHAGDCRVYVLRKGSESLELLTADNVTPDTQEDFEFQDEQKELGPTAMVHNVLGQKDFKPVVYTCVFNPGDKYAIICDGVYENLSEKTMAKCLKESAGDQEAAKNLVEKAEKASGQAKWKEQETSLQDMFPNPAPSSLQNLFTKPTEQESSAAEEPSEQVDKTSPDKIVPKPDDMTAIVGEIKEKENVANQKKI